MQAALLDNGLGGPLSLFGHRYWHLFGPFYLLRLIILTYPSVAGFIFAFSPISPPAGCTPS
jgi:hypothetical protein